MRDTAVQPPIFSGHLSDMLLASTLQMLHAMGRTCVVHVMAAQGQGRLHYRQGQLIHAIWRGLTGEAALPGLVQATDGTFEVRESTEAVTPTIDRPHELVMMAAVTGVEAHTFVPEEPSEASADLLIMDRADGAAHTPAVLDARDLSLPPTPADHVPIPLQPLTHLTLSGEAWRVLSLMDGQRDIAAISAAARVAVSDVQTLLDRLALDGYVRFGVPMMPPAFWKDVQREATFVLGVACVYLMEEAAEVIEASPGDIPRAMARHFIFELVGATRPDRRTPSSSGSGCCTDRTRN
ncbi:DUF4388 domain-containing protein [Deinococcus multiflagellatus]|uniref:DUF4388 domain-containing protein n=1 Tax=Deinococcus multiflagellatus TaxID=1656887 RepID=A0ABW1ZQQ3_9DEIO